MNVNNVTQRVSLDPGEDAMLKFVEQQTKLMEKYHDIEKDFRLTHDCPVDLHDRFGQLLIKDFAWRTTEEIAEAMDAYDNGDSLIHIQEEIADAFHFFIELGILANFTFTEGMLDTAFDSAMSDYDLHVMAPIGDIHEEGLSDPEKQYCAFYLIKGLGMLCHTLKNKPWKQSHMLTDTALFYERYENLILRFAYLSISFDMDKDDFFHMYFRKAAVNEFRQRSNY